MFSSKLLYRLSKPSRNFSFGENPSSFFAREISARLCKISPFLSGANSVLRFLPEIDMMRSASSN